MGAALSRHLRQVANDGGEARNRIAGARLITAQETESGRRWAESRIKAMTGGDRRWTSSFSSLGPQHLTIA